MTKSCLEYFLIHRVWAYYADGVDWRQRDSKLLYDTPGESRSIMRIVN